MTPFEVVRRQSEVPIQQVDLAKRYDVYYTHVGEDRVYENVRFLGIRTFDQINDFGSGLIGGFLEIETPNGAQFMIPNHGIQMICEHGVNPQYRTVRVWDRGHR